jgi:triosephosphate isomerase (TIM)
MRKKFIAGNWKMYTTAGTARALAEGVAKGVTGNAVTVAVCPPFPWLGLVADAVKGSAVAVGAQNCHYAAEGAYTGEVSPQMLLAAGCQYVIVGHSERRQLLGELDAAVNLKARAALKAGLTPIICVGETLAERDAGETIGRVQAQVDAALADMNDAELARVVVAYEPIWAIGTGRNATPAQAEEVHRFIRSRVGGRSAAVAAQMRILYGGSVKPDNIRALMAEEDVDGGLVGGASLSAESFVRLVKEGASV